MDLKHTTKDNLYEMLCEEQERAKKLAAECVTLKLQIKEEKAKNEALNEEIEDVEARIKAVRKERDEYSRRYYQLFNHPWKALWEHIRRVANL